jgi:hypothetical protein
VKNKCFPFITKCVDWLIYSKEIHLKRNLCFLFVSL